LVIGGTRVTDDGIESLKKALPDVETFTEDLSIP